MYRDKYSPTDIYLLNNLYLKVFLSALIKTPHLQSINETNGPTRGFVIDFVYDISTSLIKTITDYQLTVHQNTYLLSATSLKV